ncbi:MAG: PIN domain-containing protein [Actinomycetota bacterium]
MTNGFVLVDTSAWLRFFEPGAYGEPEVADEVERLVLAGKACYTEPVYLEIAAGAADEKTLQGFKRDFSVLVLKSVCVQDIWTGAADSYPALVKKGFRKKAIDVLIASVARHYGLTLFHHDSDYPTIARAVEMDQYSFLK